MSAKPQRIDRPTFDHMLGELDALRAKNAKARKDAAEATEAAIRDRTALHVRTHRVLPGFRFDGQSSRDVMVLAIQAVIPGFVALGSDDYVRGVFESVTEI